MTPFLQYACVSIAILLLASCSPIVDTRGHTAELEDLKQLVVGQSGKDDVTALLGSPTTQSSYGDDTWYYITQKRETVGIFSPKVVEQHVTAIRFDGNGTVADIAEFKKEDGKPVELVRKTTPTEGHEMTIMEQMLGNFGRFSAPGRSINPRDLGR